MSFTHILASTRWVWHFYFLAIFQFCYLIGVKFKVYGNKMFWNILPKPSLSAVFHQTVASSYFRDVEAMENRLQPVLDWSTRDLNFRPPEHEACVLPIRLSKHYGLCILVYTAIDFRNVTTKFFCIVNLLFANTSVGFWAIVKHFFFLFFSFFQHFAVG